MAIPDGDVAAVYVSTVFMLALAAVIILRGPLGRALARRIEATAGAASDVEGRIDRLEHRTTDLEVLQTRLGELEERVDFTERLLAQQRAPGLGPGVDQ